MSHHTHTGTAFVSHTVGHVLDLPLSPLYQGLVRIQLLLMTLIHQRRKYPRCLLQLIQKVLGILEVSLVGASGLATFHDNLVVGKTRSRRGS